METYGAMTSTIVQDMIKDTSSGNAPVPDADKYTLFAPLNSAFWNLHNTNDDSDFSRDTAQVDEVGISDNKVLECDVNCIKVLWYDSWTMLICYKA